MEGVVTVEAMLRRGLVLLTSFPPAYNAPFVPGGAMAVFGRYSQDLAVTLGDTCNKTRPAHLVVSGNAGKDSGQLATWGIPEAHYLLSGAAVLNQFAMSEIRVGVDLDAKNGLDNALRMTSLLTDFGYAGEVNAQLQVVAHSTQMLRLGMTLNRVLLDARLSFASVRWVASSYRPSMQRWQDQWEICFELIKLDEMRQKGWVDNLPIPDELLDWARGHVDFVAAEMEAQGIACSTAGLRSF